MKENGPAVRVGVDPPRKVPEGITPGVPTSPWAVLVSEPSAPVGSLTMDSPVGPLRLVADGAALREIRFGADPADVGREWTTVPVLALAREQLAAYFAGRLRVFDLPLAPGGTPFQHRVWDQLLRIPWGTTTTYGAIAAALGMPVGASRAVGAANGANPVPIVVPCHRVIGADGTLTGYAGGMDRKSILLRLERVATVAGQAALF